MNSRKIILTLFTFYLLFGTATAQSIINKIIKAGEIRVGMTGTQPPFSMKAKSGEIIGYEVDLANLLAEGMGVKVKIVEMPFASLLGAGSIDPLTHKI